MLNYIEIKNFLLIKNLKLDLSDSLTVITGETGSGKSTIMQAIQLCLGAKSNTSYISTGHDNCEITIIFNDIHSTVSAWLKDKDLLRDNEVIIRRKLSIDGKSKIYINDSLCSLQSLKEIGMQLVGLQGQRDNLLLLKPDFQLKIIDDFGQLHNTSSCVKELYEKWKEIQVQIYSMSEVSENETTSELLQYQINELKTYIDEEDNIQKIEEKHQMLSNYEKISHNLSSSIKLLDVDSELYSSLQGLKNYISNLNISNIKLPHLYNPLEQIEINVEELLSQLNIMQDNSSYDEEEFSILEAKLTSLFELGRKHKCDIKDLPKKLSNLEERLESILNKNDKILALKKNQEQIQIEYIKKAKELSTSRIKVAKKIDKLVSIEIKNLGMQQGLFQTEISNIEGTTPRLKGMDTVEFKIKLNNGHPFSSLRKCASGGELSRISLAIQVSTQNSFNIPTFLFDEIDVGISGSTGSLIGTLLKQLSENKQVICITHSPQVAAFAKNHLKVSKRTVNKTTISNVENLDEDGKVEELSRLLGGLKTNQTSVKAAKALIEEALSV